jgi:hypothetical protein
MSKLTLRIVPFMLLLLSAGATLTHAQGASVYFGVGGANDSSNNQQVDGSGDIGPSLTGVFITIGGDVMPRADLGFGAEYSFHATQTNYAPSVAVNARPIFYDFNVIYHPPTASKRIVPELQGGLGGADVKFYETQSGCEALNVCQTINQYISSSDHFQVHGALGVRIYVTPNLFVRPQFDIHWVNNYQEYGSDWVPQYGVSVGYTFGQQ